MKDRGTKVLEGDSTVDTEGVEHEKVINIVDGVNKKSTNGQNIVETDDDVVDELTNNVKELNIQLDDEKEDDGLVKRGPHGGVATQHYTGKNLPIGPFGNYIPNTGYVQMQNNNGRRGLEIDDQDYGNPSKFYRPVQQVVQQPVQQSMQPPQIPMSLTLQHEGMIRGFTGPYNNLNEPSQGNTFNISSYQHQVLECNTMNNSGGKVIVQSPTGNGISIVDRLLEEVTQMQPIHSNQNTTELKHTYSTSLTSNHEENVMSPTPSVSSVNMASPRHDRRASDPLSDSGVESAEEKSPYSDVAPSPNGSTYSCPPSVESGYGRSPLHEPGFGQSTHVMPSPKYPGIMSPTSNRVTPSPGSSVGYYSPVPQNKTEEFFADPTTKETLNDVYEYIESELKDDQNRKFNTKQPMPVYPNLPQAPMGGNPHMPFLPNQQQIPKQQIPKQPLTNQQPVIPFPVIQPTARIPPNILPTTISTTTAPQPPFIIIPNQSAPTNAAPVILVTTQIPKTQPEKSKKPRKILPKSVSTTLGSTATTATNAGVVTSTSPANRNNIMTPREGGPINNRNGLQPSTLQAQQQQSKLLMIARRTVADMKSEELKKSDDEGDTYLHIAVCKTDKHMVQALLERLRRENLDHLVDQENNKRQTPLYLAVYINQPVMVAMFIQFQANVNVLAQSMSSDGQTREVKAAIHVAASQGHEYIDTLRQLLLAKDISINIVNNYGQTALHCAIAAHNRVKRNSEDRINSINIIKMLIKAGADVSAQDQKSGKTPLMYAIEQRDLLLVETILSCIEPSKMRNVVRTQAFDGSSCLKIAEGLKDSYNVQAWNKLWNSLQSAASGTGRFQPTIF